MPSAPSVDALRARVADLLAAYPPTRTPRLEFLRARFDAGLAWVHYPEGLGGLGAPRALQSLVDEALRAAGAPDNDPGATVIGLGMAGPTLLAAGTPEQQRRFLRPLWTGEEVWCQLFSEPDAGSDLAALSTRAQRDGDSWVVHGQKVWTSLAHRAKRALLVARTDPSVPKHRGLTYFVLDMHQPGVEVRPLRQITGEAEFNEVFLHGARVADRDRLGDVGDGWRVALATLMNERTAIGAGAGTLAREWGALGVLTRTWRARPELRTPGLHDRMLRVWVAAEAARLTAVHHQQQIAAGHPGPEGSAAKLTFAAVNQATTALELELVGEEGLRYDDWTARPARTIDPAGRGPGYRYLRARGNSIEGGTSEVLRNIIAERVLGLPAEPRTDKTLPWKELPR